MSETTPGREPVQIVEIEQPICTNTFGVTPCTATGTDDQKCHNTRATCLDTANYALDATPLSLFFVSGKTAEMAIADVPYPIPSLVRVSTSPTRINLAGANPDAQGLGNRALATIRLKDHAHTDRRVDPYVDGRSWDPLDPARGSFWSRWKVRNKYRNNIRINIYEGYAGDALSAMKKRSYFLYSLTGPDSDGAVTIQAKDVLYRIEERQAQAPKASPGELYAAIGSGDTSIEVAGAVEADYGATGTLRINDELMTYSARATSANGITFTITARGTDNTTAASHDAEDAVQECLRFAADKLDTVLTTLLDTFGGVPAAMLDSASWATEIAAFLISYDLTTVITEPTAVNKLVSELQEQIPFYLWWDERAALVRLKAIIGITEVPATLTAETHFLAGSVKFRELPRQRVSQAWVYYSIRDFTQGLRETTNYAQQHVLANLETEADELYGTPSIRKVFSRWLRSGALAANTATKILTRYVDVPVEVTFSMDAKDRGYWVGDIFKLSHHLFTDAFGARQLENWTITSAEEIVPGEVVRYTAENTALLGQVHYIMADAAADYPGAASVAFKSAYIGDSAGVLSDGTSAARIA